MRDGPAPRSRSQARSRALQLLYLHDQGGSADMAEQFRRDQPARAEVESFARELVESVRTHQGDLDELIRAQAQHWDLERMAVVDRNVLRLGLCELLHFPKTPRQVVIDEAVELAKAFGGARSGAFVNGILDHVVLPASLPEA